MADLQPESPPLPARGRQRGRRAEGHLLGGLRGRPRGDPLGARRAAPRPRSDLDGSLAVRCSCRAAICGSCGVKINGESALACKTQLQEAPGRGHAAPAARGAADHGRAHGEHAGDQGPGHRHGVDPLDQDPPGHAVAAPGSGGEASPSASTSCRPESMIDITQSMACIQCGACVSSCLVDGGRPGVHRPGGARQGLPLRRRPARRADDRAALGPRPGPARHLRLHPLLRVHRRLPEGRRADGPDHAPAPAGRPTSTRSTTTTTAHRHEHAFVKIIEKKGTLDESLLLQESYAPGRQGQADSHRARSRSCSISLPTAVRGIRTGKMRSLSKLIPGVHPKLPGDAQDHVKRIYAHAEEHREELNLYIAGEEELSEMSHARPPERADRRSREQRRRSDHSEARLLARLRLARLHPRAARLDGAGRRAARDRAGHPRPRQLLRRRRDRRAQPGARRHAERAHLRPRPVHRPGDDEHLLDLPGRAVGVPAAPRRRLRLPRPHQRGARGRGPEYEKDKDGFDQQELPLGAGRGLRARDAQGEGQTPPDRPARRSLLRLLHHPPQAPPRLRRASRPRPVPGAGDRGAGRRGRGVRRAPASAAASR